MADKCCKMIEGLERRWCDALCSRDLDQLGELVHPDFVLIGSRPTGPFEMHREEWLEAIQRRDVVGVDAAEPRVQRSHVVGRRFAHDRVPRGGIGDAVGIHPPAPGGRGGHRGHAVSAAVAGHPLCRRHRASARDAASYPGW